MRIGNVIGCYYGSYMTVKACPKNTVLQCRNVSHFKTEETSKISKKIQAFTLALSLALSLAAIMLPAQAAQALEDLVIRQVAPLTGTIAGTGNEYVAGGAAYFAHVHHARSL